MAQNWKQKFILLWMGQAVSLLTSAVLQMSIVWYLVEQTGSAAILSIATLIGYVPEAVLGTFVGVFIDRYNRKYIMMLADLFIAFAGMVLVVVGLFQEIPIWLIMVVLFFRSVGSAFHYPSLQAITPSIVPKEKLTQYAGYAQSFENVSMVLSPALAALLFSIWNLNVIIFMDVLGALFAVTCLCFLKIPNRVKTEAMNIAPNIIRETIDGLRILKSQKGMLSLLLISALYAVIYFPIGNLYPLITMSYFRGGIAESSIVEVVFAAGSLVGSLLLGVVGGKMSKMGAITKSIAIYGAGLLITGLLPPSGFKMFVLLSAIMGISGPFFTGVQTAIFQLRIQEDYLGRIFSLSSSVSRFAMPLGLILSGAFADVIGVEKWFLISGIMALLLSVYSLMLPSLRHCCDSE